MTTLPTRRAVVGGMALAGTAVVVGIHSTLDGVQAHAANENVPEVTQYGFLVNTSNCTNCAKCIRACRDANQTPDNLASRRRIVDYANDFGKHVHLSIGCMQCEKPACATVCPAGAISKRTDGIVTIDHDRCIGCKYCYQACPFGVPHYGNIGMDKCDCCLEAGVTPGDEPNCVKACSFGALQYGNIAHLAATVGRKAKAIDCSTNPSYLLL